MHVQSNSTTYLIPMRQEYTAGMSTTYLKRYVMTLIFFSTSHQLALQRIYNDTRTISIRSLELVEDQYVSSLHYKQLYIGHTCIEVMTKCTHERQMLR